MNLKQQCVNTGWPGEQLEPFISSTITQWRGDAEAIELRGCAQQVRCNRTDSAAITFAHRSNLESAPTATKATDDDEAGLDHFHARSLQTRQCQLNEPMQCGRWLMSSKWTYQWKKCEFSIILIRRHFKIQIVKIRECLKTGSNSNQMMQKNSTQK